MDVSVSLLITNYAAVVNLSAKMLQLLFLHFYYYYYYYYYYLKKKKKERGKEETIYQKKKKNTNETTSDGNNSVNESCFSSTDSMESQLRFLLPLPDADTVPIAT
ncbi:hypothetical protein RFI_35523, partial [Reticulomyxa filosa]